MVSKDSHTRLEAGFTLGYKFLMPYSKAERNVYMKKRRALIRQRMLLHLGGQCARCGGDSDLEINHVDPRNKTMALAAMYDKPWTEVVSELAKCEVLCHDHHLEETSSQYRLGLIERRKAPPRNKKVFRHGTARMYAQKGCRCPRCCKAKKEYLAGNLKNSEIVR